MSNAFAASIEPSPASSENVTRLPLPHAPPWSPARRFAFRLLFAYVALYSFDLAANSSFGWDWLTQVKLWHAIVPFIGKHVLHLHKDITVFTNGSGDTTYNWLLDGLWLFTALVAAGVWSILDRKRQSYERLFGVLRLWVRYALAYQLMSYGFAKVFKLQFPAPGPSRLREIYGDSSPMGILWTFMGASGPYTIFGGLAEVTGGVLLLFRRTTTLGALVVAAVMTNVVMLNFCYDVPVKLLSTHLLLAAIWLMLPDARRLVDVLVLHRPTQPSLRLWTPASRRGVWARRVLKYGLLAYLGFSFISSSLQSMKRYNPTGAKPPSFGVYDVVELVRGGKVVDPKAWREVGIGEFGGVVKLADRTMQEFGLPTDGKIEQWTDDPAHHYMSFAMPDAQHVVLSGKFVPFDNDEVKVTLVRLPEQKYLLNTRGFHLISEEPYNR